MSFPTQITVLRILLVPVFYVLFAVVEPAEILWASVVFLLAALSDWYDGYFARQFNSITALGAFLDPLADKLLTSTALIAFATQGLIPLWMVMLVVLRDVYLTLMRVYSENLGLTLKTSYTAKVKTFLQMVFIGYVLIALVVTSDSLRLGGTLASGASVLVDGELLYWLMGALTTLTMWTAVQYTYGNWQVLNAVVRRYLLRRSPQKL